MQLILHMQSCFVQTALGSRARRAVAIVIFVIFLSGVTRFDIGTGEGEVRGIKITPDGVE